MRGNACYLSPLRLTFSSAFLSCSLLMGETEMQCRHLLFCPFIKQPRRQVMVKQLLQRNLKVSAFSILLHSGVPTSSCTATGTQRAQFNCCSQTQQHAPKTPSIKALKQNTLKCSQILKVIYYFAHNDSPYCFKIPFMGNNQQNNRVNK